MKPCCQQRRLSNKLNQFGYKGERQYSNKTIRGTKKDAEKWLNKALRDKDLGIYVEPTVETVSQFLHDGSKQ